MVPRLAVVLCLAALLSANSAAAPREVCEKYARDAVASQKLNFARRCELKGDPWSLNERDHFNWCLGQDASALQRENRNRSSHLARCDRCAEYSRAAIDAQTANLRRGCGLSGNLWSDNERNHYRWCTRVDKAHAERDAGRRDQLLLACRR